MYLINNYSCSYQYIFINTKLGTTQTQIHKEMRGKLWDRNAKNLQTAVFQTVSATLLYSWGHLPAGPVDRRVHNGLLYDSYF